jgi:hypothetical protein
MASLEWAVVSSFKRAAIAKIIGVFTLKCAQVGGFAPVLPGIRLRRAARQVGGNRRRIALYARVSGGARTSFFLWPAFC